MSYTAKAILFDLGDTLLDFGRVDLNALFDQGGKLAYEYLQGLDIELPHFAEYARKHLWAIRLRAAWSFLTSREFHSRDLMRKVCGRLGIELDDAQLDEVSWLWYKPLHHQATVEEGLAEMLQGFLDEGLKLGIISNTFVPGEVLDRHLEEEGLLRFFDVRVYSCDIGRRKPARRIFRVALARIGTEAPETIFVGDSPRPDIRGGNRMGMTSVLKDPDGEYDQRSACNPNHRIRSILELREIVARYRTPA
ncbi:MAG: HAD-IA family hydrolase [Planctomycetes bacterium]|jgi:HAD superfamily hydrolase (TIGR01549 family)|nr:HAD family hydrolase [Phycisphaerae bacterium]NBB95670.1 HAD-IA family hydrolase [Planctomycetota bacterium]